jgi:hypothetical protein
VRDKSRGVKKKGKTGTEIGWEKPIIGVSVPITNFGVFKYQVITGYIIIIIIITIIYFLILYIFFGI